MTKPPPALRPRMLVGKPPILALVVDIPQKKSEVVVVPAGLVETQP